MPALTRWLGQWLSPRRLHTRIAGISLLLLLLVQASGFVAIGASIQGSARQALAAELEVGERIWSRLLEQKIIKLQDGARVLAADYGFRSALGPEGDAATLASALENVGERIGASVAAWVDAGLHVALVSGAADRADAAAPLIVASTLPPEAKAALANATASMTARTDGNSAVIGGETLMLRSVPLGQGIAARVLLMRSVDEAMARYESLHLLLLAITVIGVCVFAAGSLLTARRITTPLRALVRASERLGRGDYSLAPHPQRGLIPPMQFIPFAEQTGFVRQLTLWMIEETARQWPAMRALGLQRVSVNLSTRDLLDQDLLAKLETRLRRHGAPNSAFCLEITESAIMDEPQRALAMLNALSLAGFKLSIDDFGTGYSSLAYLKKLPVDELKIDKSFVMGMAADEDDAKIVRSTIDLAHNLGLSVVAEGVETAPILERLRDLRCDEAQGYHMSKPLPAVELAGFVVRWTEAHAAVAV